jgi:hypothetical protein
MPQALDLKGFAEIVMVIKLPVALIGSKDSFEYVRYD